MQTNTQAFARSKTTTLSESAAITLMQKFMPVLYFNTGETYYPTKIEDFPIDWSKVTIDDSSAIYNWGTWKGNTKLDSSVPLYTSILENSDGTCSITYMFLYGFNDKGPTFNFKVDVIGDSIKKSIEVGNYGMDLHYSDVEHIEITLNKGYGSVKEIIYAYHKWTTTVEAKDVEFEDSTHPVVYVGKGSHASYHTAGDQTYDTFWSKKGTGYSTYGILIDYPPSSKTNAVRFYSSNPRLLKLNGSQTTTTNLSTAEIYVGFKYSGHMGMTWPNVDVNNFKKDCGYDAFMSVLKKLSKKDYDEISASFNAQMEAWILVSESTQGFYGRGYW